MVNVSFWVVVFSLCIMILSLSWLAPPVGCRGTSHGQAAQGRGASALVYPSRHGLPDGAGKFSALRSALGQPNGLPGARTDVHQSQQSESIRQSEREGSRMPPRTSNVQSVAMPPSTHTSSVGLTACSSFLSTLSNLLPAPRWMWGYPRGWV